MRVGEWVVDYDTATSHQINHVDTAAELRLYGRSDLMEKAWMRCGLPFVGCVSTPMPSWAFVKCDVCAVVAS